MIILNNHVIFLHIHAEYLKCDLWELESTQNHLWLIFNKCLKFEKALPCYFYYISSTLNLGLRPVGLARYFHKLSKNIYFIIFGSVDIFLFNFENGNSIEFELNWIIRIWMDGLARETTWAREKKKSGSAQLRVSRECAAWQGAPPVSGS